MSRRPEATLSRRPNLFVTLTARESARLPSGALVAMSLRQRLSAVDISTHLELGAVHHAPVTSLSLDAVDCRFLLSAAADGTIALYDTEDRPPADSGSTASAQTCTPLAIIPREHAHTHRGVVSAVQWFPHDTGLFATTGHDGLVKLWDTNELVAACDFTLPGRVHTVAMSSTATYHALLATGAEGTSSIHLCDAATGSAAQVLVGHRAPVWALSWSPREEYVLASGGADRSVRLWDIRRAGSCLKALDQHDTLDERRRLTTAKAPVHVHAAIAKARTSTGSTAVSASTTVAAAARELATPNAHNGPVSSVCYCADGLMLLTAGRDHRMRLWDAHSGANTLVHYAGAFNTARGHKQLAVTAGGDRAASARVYFPGNDGLLVYDLLSGRKLQTLKAHLGEVICCAAAPHEPRVFTGGTDCNIHAWTPPPCGLYRAAPPEQPDAPVGVRRGAADNPAPSAPSIHRGSGRSELFEEVAGYYNAMPHSAVDEEGVVIGNHLGHDDGIGGGGGNRGGRDACSSGGGRSSSHGGVAARRDSEMATAISVHPVAEDCDAWSDEDEDEAEQARAVGRGAHGRGHGGRCMDTARKRPRLGR